MANALAAARGLLPVRRTVRIGVTGLARAGKTALLTSLAANLLASGAGLQALPNLSARLAGRSLRVRIAPSGADTLPRFDHAGHLAALAADPPRWPARTNAVSLLALDVDITRTGLTAALPPKLLRLELLDYPGEWLLDLPLAGLSFAEWARRALADLEPLPQAREFLAFARGLASSAAADEVLARSGAQLYRRLLLRLRDEVGLSLLQPGRFLMPAPGPEPPWVEFFPATVEGPLGRLLGARYDEYVRAVTRDLASPSFGRLDRLVVAADVLTSLHNGRQAFEDAAKALGAVAQALRWRSPLQFVPAWLGRMLPWGGISRVAFVGTKADHIAERQRGNFAALVGTLARVTRPGPAIREAAFAVAAVRCTEDFVWALDGRPVSAVRGRVEGQGLVGSYPGEVPDHPPDAEFWLHPFLAIPTFEPKRLPLNGRGGVPHIAVDTLLVFLLEDLL